MGENSAWLGICRGLRLRCPHCGEGKLFGRFLKVADRCGECGADNSVYPADDAPPYLTLLLVGHIFIPIMFWIERAWEPALLLQLSFWLPAVAAATVFTLPYMKGAVVGIAWATGVTRETALQ
jgi:uncharacterized protein (DUF983 family)